MLNFLLETFLLGLKNLRLHKLRSLLTALGIILGVAAVIIMISIGEGAKQAALEQLQQLGARNVLLRSVVPAESTQASQRATRLLDYGLRRADLTRLEGLPQPNLSQIVPMRNTEQKITLGDVRANGANAIGTIPEAFDVINLPLSRGRYFNQVDFDNHAHVCVIGAMVARQLFPYGDPLGQDLQIGTPGRGTVICSIVGVLEPTGVRGQGQEMIGRDLDLDLYFPLNVAQEVFHDTMVKVQAGTQERKNVELTEIWLQADEVDHVEAMASLAENILSQSHTSVDYQVKAPISILRAAEASKKIFNIVLVSIAGFALLVGGVGIMNIMLATVTERTREIGIRRALGAKQRHITLQFLIETTVISVSGGLIGIGMGAAIAKLVPVVAPGMPTSITTWSVVGSFVLSAMIGIGFGLYPAIKAAQMNPIEALRHE